MQPFDLVSVALFGHPDGGIADKLTVADAPDIEAAGFRCGVYNDDGDLHRALAELRPQVIFTFGDASAYPRLHAAPLDVRRRWLHFDAVPSPHALAESALRVFVDVATNDRFPNEPLVSVFTPTYRTGERLLRPFRSLLDQTYGNWEWVVYDDSPDDETFDRLRALAVDDPRVRVFRGDRNCGVIGEVKRRLCGLARGSVLAELDHDDALTDHCLADVVEAFRAFPDAGFAYTDCAEVFEDGDPAGYAPGWGFGFGSYRDETYQGRQYLVTNYPSINSKTMRHIVGVPNHVRAWRRDAYEAIGGYASEVHVADDYELLVRTFLHTRMVHVQRFGYMQFLQRDGGNTQRRRNKEIQRLVRLFHARYEDEIHARFVELGVDDFIWRDGQLDWSTPNPSPAPVANYVLR
jgi:glycosyltransferase involved in cell wall biosynthesis